MSRRALMQRALVVAAGTGAIAVSGCGDSTTEKTATPTNALSPTPEHPSQSSTTATHQAWMSLSASGGPSARRDHSMTFDPTSGLVYLFGGRRAGGSLNDLWAFDPNSIAWKEIVVAGEKPAARFAQVAIFDGATKRLIITTGQGDGSVFFNDVWAFDPLTKVWSELGAQARERPEIRYGAGGAHDTAGHRIFLSHGFTDQGRFDDTRSFDLTASTWTKLSTKGSVPIKRCLTRCVWLAHSKQLLLFGGQTDATPFLGDFWSLDVASGKWNEQKPAVLPGARNLYGSGFDGAHWYIFGGNTIGGPTAETWMYDIANEAWAQVNASPLPPARYSTDAVLAGGRLYAFGGHDSNTELGDTWALDLAG